MRLIGLIFAILIVALGASGVFEVKRNDVFIVFPNGTEFSIEVADDPIEKVRGLSGRESLLENSGMLFLYDEPSKAGIWMRDMNFPIDIIWLREGEVVHIVEKAVPDDSLNRAVYSSKVPADMVLEVPEGTVKRNSIEVGDNLIINGV